MDPELIEQAERYGIKTSMYLLLPPHRREKALLKDLEKAKKQAVRAVAKGENHD